MNYHFIRQLSDGSWYNKSGRAPGGVIPAEWVANGPYGDGIWYAYSPELPNDGVYKRVYYDGEIIYFAVKIGWDSR